MVNQALFSSKNICWETPDLLFQELDKEFSFTLDVCANESNYKVSNYISESENSLERHWLRMRKYGSAWMNPPYGRTIGKWLEKASIQRALGLTVVTLLPSRTDTKWFHTFIYNKPNVEIRFLKGRVKFKGATNSAPFPSMVVIFHGK